MAVVSCGNESTRENYFPKIPSTTIPPQKSFNGVWTFWCEDIYEKFDVFMKSLKETKQDKKIKQEFVQFEKQLKRQKEKKDKRQKGKNVGKYMKLVSNKNLINDVKFFKESLNLKEQESMIAELEKVKSVTTIDKPYRIQLLENENIPNHFKAIALKKINAMKLIADGGGEYNKLKNWIDNFMRIPFNVVSTLPISKTLIDVYPFFTLLFTALNSCLKRLPLSIDSFSFIGFLSSAGVHE